MRSVWRFPLGFHGQDLLIVFLLVQQTFGLFRRHLSNPGSLRFAVGFPGFRAVLIFIRRIWLRLILLALILFRLARLVLLILLLVLLAGILLLIFLRLVLLVLLLLLLILLLLLLLLLFLLLFQQFVQFFQFFIVRIMLQPVLHRLQRLRDIVGNVGVGAVVEKIIGGQPLRARGRQNQQPAKAD